MLYDLLPRILNAIFLYFIFPMVFAYFTGMLGSKLLIKIEKREGHYDEHIFFTTVMICSLLVWLAVLPTFFTGTKHYIQLNIFKKHISSDIENLNVEEAKNAGFITFSTGRLLYEYYGFNRERRTTKSGDSTSVNIYDYYAVPVTLTPADKNINVWICDDVLSGEGTSAQKKPEFFKNKNVGVCGVVIQDSNQIEDCLKAVENAETEHKLSLPDEKEKNILLLKPAKDFDTILGKYEKWSLIYFIILNILFVIVPTYMTNKKTKTRR